MLEILGETLEAGAIIASAYRLERVLGEGGMGVVWAAQELATRRTVALKFLRAGRETDPRNQQRFLREAHAAMAITHPSIAKVEAVLETDAGVPFLVMELLVGESLRALLERRGTLTLAECARVMVPVVDAVMAAHAGGVVHRDLKPENIFLVSDQDVRVLDFGIAKVLAEEGATLAPQLTSTGVLLGTPLYMAPEQIFGDPDIDGRADVWSMGIVLYECLAARRPTDGEGFGPIIKRITTGTLLPLEQARPGLPGRLTRLVDAMLTRKKDERPPLSEVRAVLESVARTDAPLPSEQRPHLPDALAPTLLAPLAPSARRGARIGLAAAALVVLLGGAWGVTTRWSAPAVARPTPAASLPTTTATQNVTADSMALLTTASEALQHHDGATCLRALDAFDAQVPPPVPSTHAPASSYATVRAMCMMLAGDCEGGKAAYAHVYPIIAAASHPTPALVLSATDSTAAQYCEGAALSPRDELMRANFRLATAGGGLRTATPAECREWHATEVRLGPRVTSRGEDDSFMRTFAQGIDDRASSCFAYAGDCAEAYRLFRDDWMAKNPLGPGGDVQLHEQTFRSIYAGRTGPTPCRGKP